MMLYLTGAASSLAKSQEAGQNDVSKSLGGYISSSIVPNGSINALFDTISLNTLKNKPKETIAIALINKFNEAVANVSVKLVTKADNIGKFKIAAVGVGEDYCMEHIDNRYAEPIQAEFHDVDFYRASVNAEIKNPCIAGEIIYLEPFNVTIEVEKSGIDGTMEAILNAFSINNDYTAIRLSEKEFSIVSKDENVVETPLDCSALCTEDGEIEFLDAYKNGKNNEALIAETLEAGKAIGLWIQREIVPKNISDEEMIENYNNKVVIPKSEEVELVIEYEAAPGGTGD